VTLAGIELRYLVNRISKEAEDYYVSNIYGINKDTILFKLHHPEKTDIFLVISTSGIWITSKKVDQIEPNRLVKRLRSDLLRLKLKKTEQIGSERIAYLTFSGFDKEFVLVGEFFGEGNILLCNKDMKILALQHSIDVRHRKLAVGLEYTQPPQSGLDIFDIKQSDIEEITKADISVAKWIGRNLGLPKKYVEGIFNFAQIDSKRLGNSLLPNEVEKIFQTTKKIVNDVVLGNHSPIIWRNDKTEVMPIKLGNEGEKINPVTDFMEGLDIVFTENIVEKGRLVQTSSSDKKLKDLESQLAEQKKAIETVKNKAKSITNVANSLYELISMGITHIDDKRAEGILAKNNAKVGKEKGVSLIIIDDEKIKIDFNASLQSIASVLFTEAKKQSGAISSIEQIKNKTEKKIESLKNKTESEKESISVTEVRKKNWFERYRWFFTSDGILAIGGRDAPSNSAVIRKHLGQNDKVFHAEIFGSPFFILKEDPDPPANSLNEVALATVCFSRAWREGMYGLSAYWVNPNQVKKSAPSGQFLPKGSFTIEGQRNFVKISTMKLGVGIILHEGDYLLTCGPIDPIKKNSVCYAVIEPNGQEMVEAAKKIRMEFAKLKEEVVKPYTVDDFVRVLPAGKSQIKEVKLGDVE